ncbi:hypothetical protein CcI49_09140 [Frankia sp. CcI49]|nr:hypothetical protein CcI49_09140 [Frankia sp. CcI49]
MAESAGTTEAGAHKWDFLVSAAEHDESWASWIAWQLEERGYRAHLETWDVAAGAVIAEALDDAIRHAQRTIVVLSPSYLQSSMVRAAWQRAWARDPAGVRRLLIPVRVAPCDPDGLLRGIRYIDLVGLDERRSNAYLLEQIERSVVGRYRPTEAPRFPGSWE